MTHQIQKTTNSAFIKRRKPGLFTAIDRANFRKILSEIAQNSMARK